MQMIKISQIKPDPNQPRRTFNAEKMAVLEASMKKDGFRLECPVSLDEKFILVDGERRWRAAKAVGITKIPVEIKKNVTPATRLFYQLQSEGAEIETPDKYEAYAKLWKLYEPTGITQRKLGHDLLGDDFQKFMNMVSMYEAAEQAKKVLTPENVKKNLKFFRDDIQLPAVLGREKDIVIRKTLVEKAIKENWNKEKAMVIREALKNNPKRTRQILSQDYSDPHEGSIQWKLRLEVAESDIDIEAMEEAGRTHDTMFKQVDKWDQLIHGALTLRAAMKEFDFKLAPTEIRVRLHKTLTTVLPELTGYIADLEKYMISQGELDKTGTKKLKGE